MVAAHATNRDVSLEPNGVLRQWALVGDWVSGKKPQGSHSCPLRPASTSSHMLHEVLLKLRATLKESTLQLNIGSLENVLNVLCVHLQRSHPQSSG
jgi:hypothetical protein